MLQHLLVVVDVDQTGYQTLLLLFTKDPAVVRFIEEIQSRQELLLRIHGQNVCFSREVSEGHSGNHNPKGTVVNLQDLFRNLRLLQKLSGKLRKYRGNGFVVGFILFCQFCKLFIDP